MTSVKPKPGKVVRVDPMIWKFLGSQRKPKETVSAALRRLLGLPSRKGEDPQGIIYILPESGIVCQTLAEARGEAILRAVKRGKKKPTEKPLKARVIGE